MDKNKITSVREEIVSTIQTYENARKAHNELHSRVSGIVKSLYTAICLKRDTFVHSIGVNRFSYHEKSDCIRVYVQEYYTGLSDEIEFDIPIYIFTLEGEELDKAIDELADKYIVNKNKEREALRKKLEDMHEADELAEYERLRKKFEGKEN